MAQFGNITGRQWFREFWVEFTGSKQLVGRKVYIEPSEWTHVCDYTLNSNTEMPGFVDMWTRPEMKKDHYLRTAAGRTVRGRRKRRGPRTRWKDTVKKELRLLEDEDVEERDKWRLLHSRLTT